MLTYCRTDTLEVVGFSDSDYAGYVDDKKSTSCYIFMIGECFLENCQTDTDNFFYYGGRVCGML